MLPPVADRVGIVRGPATSAQSRPRGRPASAPRRGGGARAPPPRGSLEDELLCGELENGLSGDHGPLAVMREEHEQIEGSLARLGGADPADEEGRGELARMTRLAGDPART